ncbi:hypothetical protein Rhal01_01024 [Rubritalea halochordaticola]|uniref:Peptidase S74 domain-containing protein n=1 Tax=Rubritalea halochordaticola TaxID=714537 RepID=A0ABP9UYR2_9BACT
MQRYPLTIATSLLISSCSLFAQSYTTKYGTEAGSSLTSGDNNSFYGWYAGYGLTTAHQNVIIGSEAGVGVLGGVTDPVWLNYSLEAMINNYGVEVAFPYNDSESVMIGYRAGFQAGTNTFDFTAIGWKAGQYNNAGDNTFVGTESGRDNTTGYDNTFLGEESGERNTTGYENVFIGEDAGLSNTTGYRNTFVGNEAGGYGGGEAYGNTGIGHEALSDVDSWNNTAVGSAAGYDVGEGVANTFLGAHAGANTEWADFNIAIGAYAGWDNNRTNSTSNANRNINIGTGAGYNNREGEDNVVVGTFAGSGVWGAEDTDINNFQNTGIFTSLYETPSGGNTNVSRRVMLGSQARANQNDTMTIGYSANALAQKAIAIGNLASATHQDSIVIGYDGDSHGNNIMVFGNDTTVSLDPDADGVTALGSSSYRFSSATAETFSAHADVAADASLTLLADSGTSNDDIWQIQAANGGDFSIASFSTGSYSSILSAANTGDVTVAGNIIVNSDQRLKEKIAPIADAPALLASIQGKTYHWKPELKRSKEKQYGLVAQEVAAVIPELVVKNPEDGILSVNYQGFVPLLIDSVNQLQKEKQLTQNVLKQQAEEIKQLKQQLQEQQDLMERLARHLDAKEADQVKQ